MPAAEGKLELGVSLGWQKAPVFVSAVWLRGKPQIQHVPYQRGRNFHNQHAEPTLSKFNGNHLLVPSQQPYSPHISVNLSALSDFTWNPRGWGGLWGGEAGEKLRYSASSCSGHWRATQTLVSWSKPSSGGVVGTESRQTCPANLPPAYRPFSHFPPHSVAKGALKIINMHLSSYHMPDIILRSFLTSSLNPCNSPWWLLLVHEDSY